MRYSLLLLITLAISFAAHAEPVVIVQKDKKFDKTEITINKGDEIVFKNDETNVTHNVYSDGPVNSFTITTQPPMSKSEPKKFDVVGETEIECAIHTNMKLKVKVVDKK